MNKEKIYSKLKIWKESTFDTYTFQWLNCELVNLTKDKVDDDEIINLLVRWRKENQFWFRDMFDVTKLSTKKWYIDQLINKQDRILFLIKVKNSYIGHIGLNRFNFKNNSCSLDNVIRGEIVDRKIMPEAIDLLHKIGYQHFGLKKYTLETCSTNYRALKLYKNLGYKEIKREPILAIENSSGIEWVRSPQEYENIINRYNIYMEKIYE